MCGGDLEIKDGVSVAECQCCGTMQTLPKLGDDERANLYDRANHFRRNNEYDKAMNIYERILNEDKTDAEAYWSLVLCKYGIEYVEDPTSHKHVPTVNRTQYISVFSDENYKEAIANADGYQKSIYETEAKAIDEIQKGILEISSKEEPFDVFICYKETGIDGRRTPDSVLATELYHELTREGFKVFFSRITLEDKLGTAYEPYIFAALNSSRVMVVLGTKPEYFNAVWVKNEWSRYLALIKNGARKTIIPAYRDMDPYDLPEEFSHLQAQDMSKLGFMADLVRGIQKITNLAEPKQTVKETVVMQNVGDAASLLKRAYIFLGDKNWNSANEYLEKVLDIDPECSKAYLGKFMLSEQIENEESIAKTPKIFDPNKADLKKALLYASEKEKSEILNYLKCAEDEYNRINHIIEQIIKGEEIIDSVEEKFKLYELAAKNNNPTAQYMLGKCYELGYGCTVNKKLAFNNYLNSAEQDSDVKALALYKIGFYLYWGMGVAKDIQRANTYFQYSADMNYPEAQYRLGINYFDGTGVPKDTKKGIDLINTAAKSGHSRAYKSLGDISYFGFCGFEKNLDFAIEKYNSSISCETEDEISNAYLNLSRCYQQKKQYDTAVSVLMLGAEKGSADCQNELGIFYENGTNVPMDKKQAFLWYQKSADNSYGNGLYNLGRFYEDGIYVEADYSKAIDLYTRAAEKDIPMAYYKCGINAYKLKRYSAAKTFYEKAEEKNIMLACNELGLLYENNLIGNKGATENKKIAMQYYLKAANAGIAWAQYNAGRLYQSVFNDVEKALFWYKKSAEQGYGNGLKQYQTLMKWKIDNDKRWSKVDKWNKISNILDFLS